MRPAETCNDLMASPGAWIDRHQCHHDFERGDDLIAPVRRFRRGRVVLETDAGDQSCLKKEISAHVLVDCV